jgi:MFS transporter, SP family, sugar:H+ symporter
MGYISDASRYFNRSLLVSVIVIAVSTFNYGFDNQAFATTQAMDAFSKQFGTYDRASGTYELNSVWLSLFNSLNYTGFVVGEWHFRQISRGHHEPF